MKLTAPRVSQTKAHRVADMVLNLDSLGDMGRLIKELTPS
jgi:hypothetical protein